MSLSKLLILIIGAVLAIVGLFMVIQHYNDTYTLIVGAIFVVVGVVLLSGKTLLP